MPKRIVILLISFWLAPHLYGQQWKKVGNGVNSTNDVRTLYGDETSDRLLAGGKFMWFYNDDDTVRTSGNAVWDGSRWDSLAHSMIPWTGSITVQPTEWYLRYQGDLFASGAFSVLIEPGIYTEYFARLDETELRWKEVSCINNSNISYLLQPVVGDTTSVLFATGHYDQLCGLPASCVYTYDGESFQVWEPFLQIPEWSQNFVGFMFGYKGMIYMSGLFRDPYSDDPVTFMRYNGSAWEYVPGWNTTAPIKSMTIRDGILYIGGAFRQSQGAPGNYIAMFDGENWNDMGGGLAFPVVPASGIVYDLEWMDDELWVCGQFHFAGGIPSNGIAKWNGQQWCGIPGDFLLSNGFQNAALMDMAVWRDSLYVCGKFVSIDGDTIRDVAQWIGGDYTTDCSAPIPTSIGTNGTESGFTIVPNPASVSITITIPDPQEYELRLIDITGRIVLSSPSPKGEIPIAHLPSGSYQVLLQHRITGARMVERFIKP